MAKIMVYRLLIFLWLAVAVIDAADPSDPTTAGPSDPTTAGPSGPPTADPSGLTTADPSDPTTAGPSDPTTAGPSGPPTADPSGLTTADPSDPTTAGPSDPTTAGPSGPPTADPSGLTTAGPSYPTTADPSGPTTADPSGPTTADPSGPTTADPSGPTTADPSGPTTADPSGPTTEGPSDPCYPNPCGTGITCEARFNESFTCLCLAGQNYMKEEKSCADAKVFPGFLPLNMEYKENMKNKASQEFQDASDAIVNALEIAFKPKPQLGYLKSTVLEIKSIQGQKFSSLRNERKVNASVENIFKSTADITEKNVEDTITEAATASGADDLLKGAVFLPTKLCDKKPCDDETSDCASKDGSAICTCKTGYITTNYTSKICIACPSGKKPGGSDCVPCPYGYSGWNCSESWKLVLVIIGSLFGGLLIITLITLTVVAFKPSKKSSKKRADTNIGNAYITHSPVKAPLMNGSSASSQVSNASAGVPRIPRATTTDSWDRSSNLEMTPSSSRQNLVPGRNSRMYEDDLHPQNRAQTNPYSQNRAQTNPYSQNRAQTNAYPQNGVQTNPYAQSRAQTNPNAQNRAQTNPYAQSRGQINPYYTHDDGGRLN